MAYGGMRLFQRLQLASCRHRGREAARDPKMARSNNPENRSYRPDLWREWDAAYRAESIRVAAKEAGF